MLANSTNLLKGINCITSERNPVFLALLINQERSCTKQSWLSSHILPVLQPSYAILLSSTALLFLQSPRLYSLQGISAPYPPFLSYQQELSFFLLVTPISFPKPNKYSFYKLSETVSVILQSTFKTSLISTISH